MGRGVMVAPLTVTQTARVRFPSVQQYRQSNGEKMSDSRYNKGGKNPHMRTSEKRPCSECGEMAKHYNTGEIEEHKQYLYKKTKGIFKKTNSWSYCSNKRWR